MSIKLPVFRLLNLRSLGKMKKHYKNCARASNREPQDHEWHVVLPDQHQQGTTVNRNRVLLNRHNKYCLVSCCLVPWVQLGSQFPFPDKLAYIIFLLAVFYSLSLSTPNQLSHFAWTESLSLSFFWNPDALLSAV